MNSATSKRGGQVLSLCLRIVLSALFVVSSGAKLLAIDDFELYIFSYGFFSLNVSYLAARLCIAFEFLLGLFVALGWWRRWVNLAAMLLLLAFSVFLCYAALIGRTDSCQCMGRLADLNPVQSLLKNAVLIVLTLAYSRMKGRTADTGAKGAKVRIRLLVISLIMVVAGVVAVFCISVPDNWMFGPEETRFDRQLLETTLAEEPLAADSLAVGHQLVAFVTPGCPYCRMTREKLGSIARRNHLDASKIHYYEPSDLPKGYFLRITFGQRPLVVLLDEGKPVVTYHYRNISEREVCRFLK